jgi:type II secretory pathway pseudopilin PulG
MATSCWMERSFSWRNETTRHPRYLKIMNITVHKNGEQLGPFTESQVGEMLKAGQLALNDLAWTEGMDQWKPLSSYEHFQSPATQGPSPAAGQTTPPSAVKKTEPLTIWSLVLGIISIVGCAFLAGIPAVICGHVGLSRIKRNPSLGGNGMAIGGLVTGYIGTFMGTIGVIGVLAALLLPAVSSAKNAAQKAMAKNDVVQIATAINAYYTEYGKFPSGPKSSRRVEGDLLAALTGVQNKDNPRGIIFIEVQPAKTGRSGIKNGAFVDPWGGSYKVIVDANYDSQITLDAQMGSKIIRKNVAVWNDTTEHPDKSAYNIIKRQVTSWE